MELAVGIFNVFVGGVLFGMALLCWARGESPLVTTVIFAPLCLSIGVVSLTGALG